MSQEQTEHRDRAEPQEAAGSGLLGTSVRRVEDPHLLKGASTFVGNLDLPDVLVAHFVTSIEAHAVISNIDAADAAAMPGVVDVVTAADVELKPIPGNPPAYPDGTERQVLAAERVRYVGEAVAVVVAETAAQAADAAEAVVVSYEPLPAVVSIAEAESDEVLLFDNVGTNTMVSDTMGEPVDFSDCEVVVEAEFINQRLAPCPLETRTAASLWTDDGRLVHYASCQGVHPLQKGLASYYDLPLEDVRVITADVGGSFGAKARFYGEDLLLPLLAKRAGRAVRWTPTRSADMVGLGHSRAQRHRVKIGGSRDGALASMEIEVTGDCGAYPLAGPALARNACMVMPGPFRIDRHAWTFNTVVTNTTPTTAYRGAGRPEGGALVDRAADLFAAEIGMDPLELRRKNLRRPDELPYTNVTGLYYDSGNYPEALELMAAEVDYAGVKRQQAARRNDDSARKQLGIGLSTFVDRTAGVPGAEYGSIELLPGGTFRVLTGSSPYGQGHYTTWSMLVSERTGVPIADIEVVHGDTDIVPKGGITGGSRSAQKAGNAVAVATDTMVAEAKERAANLLEAAVGDVVLDIARGAFHVAGSPAAASVGWAEVAQVALAEKPVDADDDWGFACETEYEPEGPTVPYGAYAAVVEVDVETGEVELVRMVTVDDAGTILNPMIALGQVHGGVGQAIGQALFEEFVYDDNGNPLTGNFLDYAFPSAAEMPSFESHLTENPSPQNLLGFKGIAESGTIGGVPAVQNAVVDALAHLGVTHIDLPVSPQRVWQALNP